MPSYLGLYIEDNLIKYAKVSKEKENIKIDSFGVKFYSNISQAIKQIVEETYSYKTPISVNLSEETYQYFNMFSLLNKKDLEKAIRLEFETYCNEKGYNPNSLETRYVIVNNAEDKEKLKVINISENKIELNKIQQRLDGYRVGTIAPVSMSIPNLINFPPKENALIVNIEGKTTITTVIDGNVYEITTLDEGSKEILEKINLKENSYSKAYEICQNTTIYTMEGKELQEDENEYLDYIMPTLYKIAKRLQEYVTNSTIKFEKIYITGTMSVINNIDLYFQEFFQLEKCELLKPYFVSENIKINIKDYIEVNSAIAIALQGLNYGIKNMNFKKPSLSDQLPDWMKLDVSLGKKEKTGNKKINLSLSGRLDATEKWLLRGAAGVLILTLLYSGFSFYLDSRINEKIAETEAVSEYTDQQIQLANNDINSVKNKTNQYVEMKNNLTDINERLEEDLSLRGSIPNLLMEIMTSVPRDVQITQIQNTVANDERHIVIRAQSRYYVELGYFKAKLSEDGILNNVVSSQGEKQDDFVKIVIEGDLP